MSDSDEEEEETCDEDGEIFEIKDSEIESSDLEAMLASILMMMILRRKTTEETLYLKRRRARMM